MLVIPYKPQLERQNFHLGRILQEQEHLLSLSVTHYHSTISSAVSKTPAGSTVASIDKVLTQIFKSMVHTQIYIYSFLFLVPFQK